MGKVKIVFLTILAISLSTIFIVLDNTKNVYYGAKEVYRVYLKGKSIGVIESKTELEEYIDNEATEIKEKYNTNKVYAPTGLEIKSEITYNDKIMTASEIYENIKNEQDFTIEGYRITIIREESKEIDETKNESDTNKENTTTKEKEYIYLLDKNILSGAINNVVLSFVDEEQYTQYLNENQQEIADEGTIIENVYIAEEITIKKDLIPVNEKIFKDEKELAEYLLFGTIENKKLYDVKASDTIFSIANDNKLNTREFLTANRDITSENALLYVGQKVVVSPPNPVITIVEETHAVELQTVKYKTEIQEDSSYYVGYSEVVRQGVDGQNLITKKVKKENGKITNVINISTEEVKPAISRLVKTGSRTEYIVGNVGIWAWPTRSGYTITTYYGHDNALGYYRYHAAIDIAGLGCYSPIYAANDGTVITAQYNSSLGNYIEINHNNGYITLYAHLNSIYVKVGQGVSMGEVIGAMGNTGYSFGCHLHFQTRHHGNTFDPLSLYR